MERCGSDDAGGTGSPWRDRLTPSAAGGRRRGAQRRLGEARALEAEIESQFRRGLTGTFRQQRVCQLDSGATGHWIAIPRSAPSTRAVGVAWMRTLFHGPRPEMALLSNRTS